MIRRVWILLAVPRGAAARTARLHRVAGRRASGRDPDYGIEAPNLSFVCVEDHGAIVVLLHLVR